MMRGNDAPTGGLRHRKKRNTGLLYEFLVGCASEGLVDDDHARTSQALRLVRKHFRSGTQLQREFRLFHALLNTHVPSRETAWRIIESCRNASRTYDSSQLDREKSLLIRGINHTFNDASFYNRRVENYRMLATVQLLLNEWRLPAGPSDIVRVAELEEELVGHLMTPKGRNLLDEASMSSTQSDDLVVGLMLKRTGERHRGLLNKEQLALLDGYVYAMRTNDSAALHEMIDGLRASTLEALNSMVTEGMEPARTRSIAAVKELMQGPVGPIDDACIARYLRVAQLRQELES